LSAHPVNVFSHSLSSVPNFFPPPKKIPQFSLPSRFAVITQALCGGRFRPEKSPRPSPKSSLKSHAQGTNKTFASETMTTKNEKLEAVAQGMMTVPEAAEFLGICPDVVHDLMDAGQLEYVDYTRDGGKRRVRRPTKRSVLEYAANRVVLANAEA
jgi:hypothetical protein